MTTVAAPPPTSTATAPTSESRFLTIQANLLPEEVLQTRENRVVRKRVGLALVAAIVLMVLVTLFSKWQTASARSDLHSAQHHAAILTQQQGDFAPLVKAKSQTAAIQLELGKLMASDLNWSKLYTEMRSVAPAGVAITNLAGQTNNSVTPGTAAANAANSNAIFNTTDSPTVGTVTITGTATNQKVVAAYIDALNKVVGITAPYPATINNTTSTMQFTATCLITAKALGSRFAPATGGSK